jgi:hypothetical protein
MKPILKAENATLEAASFNVLQPDGFFVPYGQYPHKAGLQLFDRTAADKMASHFGGLLNRIANVMAGPAVYIGHPDVPGRGSEFTDKKAYGRITDIEPRANGCFFRAKMNREGVELIENSAFAYYSPYWGCERTQGGIRPVVLYSMGLTNQPNIDVPALANEQEKENPTENEPMKDNIKAALLKRGIITENSTEEEAEAALVAYLEKEPEDKKQPEKEEPEQEQEQEQEPEKEKEAEVKVEETPEQKAEREAMEKMKKEAEGAANDRTTLKGLFINATVKTALTTGRITGAEQASVTAELEALANTADLEAAANKLLAGGYKLKTEGTVKLGAEAKQVTAANESNGKSKARADLVEECKRSFPTLSGSALHDAAWNKARVQKPELF